jgi:tripartite-type tricarboxylate transporter receptor subunit TctC
MLAGAGWPRLGGQAGGRGGQRLSPAPGAHRGALFGGHRPRRGGAQLAEAAVAAWGQPVLVDNKPGASGIVAFGEVRRTPADGHTLFLADTATLAVNPLLHATLPYDPQRDLVPLTLLFRATFLLWVGGQQPLRTLAACWPQARRQPGA